jgi:hypothetical protein
MSFTPGRPFQVTALGKVWTLSRISIDMIFAFRDFIKSRLPNPLEGPIAKVFDRLPVEEQIARVKKAESIGEQLACFSMQSDLAQEYLRKEEGQAQWAKLWLQEFHPDVDLPTAFAVFVEASDQLARAFEVAQGQIKTPGQGGPPMNLQMSMQEPPGNSRTPAPAMPAA